MRDACVMSFRESGIIEIGIPMCASLSLRYRDTLGKTHIPVLCFLRSECDSKLIE